MPSRSRVISNRWLKKEAQKITGDVLSVGSMFDADGEGGFYRQYFSNARSYTTSDVTDVDGCLDRVLDVRDMKEVKNGTYDCLFVCGVLEHVDEVFKAVDEITRVLKKGGVLLLGVPFRQAIHSVPHDYWRFTPFGVGYLLKNRYEIDEILPIDNRVRNFPVSYWFKVTKK